MTQIIKQLIEFFSENLPINMVYWVLSLQPGDFLMSSFALNYIFFFLAMLKHI